MDLEIVAGIEKNIPFCGKEYPVKPFTMQDLSQAKFEFLDLQKKEIMASSLPTEDKKDAIKELKATVWETKNWLWSDPTGQLYTLWVVLKRTDKDIKWEKVGETVINREILNIIYWVITNEEPETEKKTLVEGKLEEK